MKDGEQVVKLLSQAGKIMASGQFSKHDLEFIKSFLDRMLKATNNVLEKTEQNDNSPK